MRFHSPVWFYFSFIALQFSSYETSINASISVFSGHLQVQPEGYNETPRIRDVIKSPGIIRTRFSSLPGVKGASMRAFGFALCSSEDRSYGVQIVGVDTNNEKYVSSIPGLVKQGKYFSTENSYEGLVGKALAENLRVKVGSELNSLGQARDGSVAATIVSIIGIYESGAPGD